VNVRFHRLLRGSKMSWINSDHDEVLKGYANLKDFLPHIDELNKESQRGKVLISTG
jgi:hypothetical protein